MLPAEELLILMERLEEKSRELSIEIQLITAWIEEHRKIWPARVEAILSPAGKRKAYQSWRKVSCRLHHRRSELKMEQERILMHLSAVNRRIEEMETTFSDFPVFSDTALATDLTSADVCA